MKLSGAFISAGREYSTLFENVPAPYVRRRFFCGKPVKRAEISVCGLGFYRFWLNGEELTRGLLSPYISNPDQILDYDVYDITDKIKTENALGFILGNGHHNCYGAYVWGIDNAPWRSAPKLAVYLEIEYTDGTVETVEADESFRVAPSPVVYDDLRMGEGYDANKEIPGWNLPQFDDSAWSAALSVEAPRGKKTICGAHPITTYNELKPARIVPDTVLTYEDNPRVDKGYLYDFGLDSSGIPHLRVKGEKGQKITMICGEYIKKDGSITIDNIRFVRSELRDLPLYLQKDEYTCKGEGLEEWEPGFTYHGFRFILVCGITPEQATPDLITYKVMSSEMEEKGGFRCSDDVANKLQAMVRNATKSNFFHFPTDCPHREKNGWTGDAALSVEHVMLNLAAEDNYAEWEKHICAAMNDEGAVPGIVPTFDWGFGWGHGPGWDIILTTIPYMIYKYRGDLEPAKLALNYMMRGVNYLINRTDEKGLVAFGLDDLYAPFGTHMPLNVSDTIFAMEYCREAGVLFEACGKMYQARYCYRQSFKYRRAFRKHLIDFDTMTVANQDKETPGCQSSQAMAIYYGMFDPAEKDAAFKVLVDLCHENNDLIDTGILGIRVLFHVLSDFGEEDLAYKMITRTDWPSYGMFVARGETSIPEDFNDLKWSAPSLNHHFMGDISAWFIKGICGIKLNPSDRNIKEAAIEPHFVSSLDFAEAFHDAPEGRIKVRWDRTAEGIALDITVPPSMDVVLRLPEGWNYNGKTEMKAQTGKIFITE